MSNDTKKVSRVLSFTHCKHECAQHSCWIVALNELTLFVVVFSRNRAIADYLRSNGHEEAYSVFKKEAELDMVS